MGWVAAAASAEQHGDYAGYGCLICLAATRRQAVDSSRQQTRRPCIDGARRVRMGPIASARAGSDVLSGLPALNSWL
jgi:hypothetical protein